MTKKYIEFNILINNYYKSLPVRNALIEGVTIKMHTNNGFIFFISANGIVQCKIHLVSNNRWWYKYIKTSMSDGNSGIKEYKLEVKRRSGDEIIKHIDAIISLSIAEYCSRLL